MANPSHSSSNATSPRGENSGQPLLRQRPFRSWIALGCALFAVAAIVLWVEQHSARVKSGGDVSVAGSVSDVPSARFTEITQPAHIDFVHQNGAYGDKLLPETMGGGCAFFDFNNDGLPDILFVNSSFWPDHTPRDQKPPIMALYQNLGGGQFRDVTAGSGLDVTFYGMGVAIGDYDNDGLDDVFITAVGQNHLFKNLGNGKFRDVTLEAGVGGNPNQWSTSCAFIDYDNDGKLDLFVCNYVHWSKELDFEVNYQLPGIGRAYGPPRNFAGSFPCLYHNDGNGKFSDVSRSSGIQIKIPGTSQPMAKSLGVAPVDLDGDGWIDLIVANDTVQNFVFHNQRNGTFKEIGAVSGLAVDRFGTVRGAMGIDSAPLTDNNRLAVAIGNFANEMTALYVSQYTSPKDPLLFTDEALAQGVGQPSRSLLTFGVFFFDYDLDGWPDLLTANGHVENEIQKIGASQFYRQPAQLFWNARGSAHPRNAFVLVPSALCGSDLLRPIIGRGSAYADIDGDGDLDVLLTQIAGPPLLLRNDQHLNHHWVRLKLVGTQCNRDAIGAVVQLRAGKQQLSAQVMPTRGYLSQSELPVTFGLGKADHVDEVSIQWPGGQIQRLQNILVDQFTIIVQGTDNIRPAIRPQK